MSLPRRVSLLGEKAEKPDLVFSVLGNTAEKGENL